MTELDHLIGQERSLREVAQTIHAWAQTQHAAEVGALHVTCSDESERECVEALQRGFIDYLLPPLKFARRSAFQLSNLGGRYEWGAAPLAEDHFRSDRSATGFTLLVAKINAHVAFEEIPQGTDTAATYRLGVWDRYGRDSTSCGALNSLMAGKRSPFLDDLRQAFDSEGRDRLSTITDDQRVDPRFQPLVAGLVSARLQGRKAVLDIQDRAPAHPTYWVVVPCVTVNRHERDTEIVCGVYTVDGREGERVVTYSGLGDDPTGYQIDRIDGRFRVTDGQVGVTRPGRQHRQMVETDLRSTRDTLRHLPDGQLERVRQDLQQNAREDYQHVLGLLKIALPIYAEAAPVQTAAFAFAHGLAGIHHAFTIHTLSDRQSGEAEAKRILQEVYDQIDHLDGRRAAAVLSLLLSAPER